MMRVFVLVLVGDADAAACAPPPRRPAELYPILFVHGFCSSADTWSVDDRDARRGQSGALRDER